MLLVKTSQPSTKKPQNIVWMINDVNPNLSYKKSAQDGIDNGISKCHNHKKISCMQLCRLSCVFFIFLCGLQLQKAMFRAILLPFLMNS